MCAALLSPPLSAPPELKSLSPSLLTSLYPSSPPPIPFLSAFAVTSEVVPGCWGPEGTPLLCVHERVHAGVHVCQEGEKLTLFTLMAKYNL